jgi:hypothetical protein
MKHLLILFSLFSFLQPASAQDAAGEDAEEPFSREERKFIRKANTAKYALYMGWQPRRFILLMNLARTNGPLLVKYVKEKYGEDYAEEKIIAAFTEINKEQKRAFLRPSLGLHLGAAVHAFLSGVTASEGHGAFMFRNILFLNLNTLVPGVESGENCEYGSRKAIDVLISLLESPGHRANILSKGFMRVGVSRNFHFEYGYNTVSMFSGPKLVDVVFYRKAMKKYIK